MSPFSSQKPIQSKTLSSRSPPANTSKWWRCPTSVAAEIDSLVSVPLIRGGANRESGKQIQSIAKSVELPFFCSTTFRLQIRTGPGSSMLLDSDRVLPIMIHRDQETGKIPNLAFVWVDDGEQLKVDIPVVFKGLEDCFGLKKEQ